MRWLVTILLLLASLHVAVAGESPRQFIHRFYTVYRDWPIRGVPFREQESLISPFCGMEIIRVFRRVNDQRELEEKKFPTDPKNPYKPAWAPEGDIFCNVWEGITNFSVGRRYRNNGRIVVEVHLEFIDQGESHSWTDRVILDRAGFDWVVYDIHYSGGGSLLESIEQELNQNGKYLNGEPSTEK